ncbi:MAG: phosphate ABC transporter permease subunit PstC [Bacteriovoracaceae bacterium]|jgi:phosphate transport system permease protein|nr:phosphate ABC transporter permease subunit PstC [Bacteriovoracaceae bacterium]
MEDLNSISLNSQNEKNIGSDQLDQRNLDWYIDKAVSMIVFIAGISAIIFIVGIFLFIAKEGLSFIIKDMDFTEFFTSPYWEPSDEDAPEYGILALILGTASVTGLAMLIAIPFSLGTAIYISEFATGRTKEFLKILVELLAAIPSVVWGFIGLTIMNPIIIKLFNVPVGLNILNAGVILGLMAAPIMTSIAEDTLKAVPDHYREAAEALGATKWQMIYKVVLPAAKNGLLGAVLLGVGRGFGETMAVLMATGHSINIPTSIFDSVRALTATIAAELGETAQGSEHYGALFTIGIFLFLITFIINLSADLIIRGVRKK